MQYHLRGQNRRDCWGYRCWTTMRWVDRVGTVGVVGRFAGLEVAGPGAAEIVGTAVVEVQRRRQVRRQRFPVWVVPGLEVVLVLGLGAAPELEAARVPELSDLAGRVRWRELA